MEPCKEIRRGILRQRVAYRSLTLSEHNNHITWWIKMQKRSQLSIRKTIGIPVLYPHRGLMIAINDHFMVSEQGVPSYIQRGISGTNNCGLYLSSFARRYSVHRLVLFAFLV
jgi:hypothetical protein